jgi:crotonobetainyl-CoA:carnitine CoA-transferase CaiB-like acyl-CoA transferase
MSRPPQYAQRKDGNQAEIVAALEKIGCSVLVMHQPADLLVGYRKNNIILEVKRPKGSKVTPAQVKFKATWRGQQATVKTVQEAINAVTATVRSDSPWP